jgi:ferredoxin
MSRAHRVMVDRIACTGHGLCAELFPEHFALDEWGYPIQSREPVRRDHLAHARRAVAACPALALRLEAVRGREPADRPATQATDQPTTRHRTRT